MPVQVLVLLQTAAPATAAAAAQRAPRGDWRVLCWRRGGCSSATRRVAEKGGGPVGWVGTWQVKACSNSSSKQQRQQPSAFPWQSQLGAAVLPPWHADFVVQQQPAQAGSHLACFGLPAEMQWPGTDVLLLLLSMPAPGRAASPAACPACCLQQVYVYEGPDADYAHFLQSLHCMVRQPHTLRHRGGGARGLNLAQFCASLYLATLGVKFRLRLS